MADEQELQANINPIPIHTPSGLGGMNDLMTITEAEISSFRFWSNDYVTKLQAAQVETGTAPYRTVNGFQCHNPIYNMDDYATNKDTACGEFLQLLGFTDENFDELREIWSDDPEHIHYKWIPLYQFTESDFNFFMNMIEAEMIGVDKIVVNHTITRYDEIEFPDEVDRIAVSMQDTGYDILKTDYYQIGDDSIGDPIPEWEDTGTLGKEKRLETSLYYGINSIKFYDSLGGEIIKDAWLTPAIASIITVSMNEAITVVSLIKTGEEEGSDGLIPPGGNGIFEVSADEEIDIDFAACTYDRYYIGETEDYYKVPDETGYYYSGYMPFYVNLFWETRTHVINSENPVNNEIGMFENDGSGNYFLRVNFQYFASPDEISYLFSAFSYVEIEEEEKKGGFIRGIIGMTLFVAGAWLFFTGLTTAAKFTWRMAAWAVGWTAKILYSQEMQAMYDEMMDAQEVAQEAAMAEAKAEAIANNRADLSYTFDYYDKLEPINPFEAGVFMPLSRVSSGSNPYTVGGEYWQPHTKLVNQRDIL